MLQKKRNFDLILIRHISNYRDMIWTVSYLLIFVRNISNMTPVRKRHLSEIPNAAVGQMYVAVWQMSPNLQYNNMKLIIVVKTLWLRVLFNSEQYNTIIRVRERYFNLKKLQCEFRLSGFIFFHLLTATTRSQRYFFKAWIIMSLKVMSVALWLRFVNNKVR